MPSLNSTPHLKPAQEHWKKSDGHPIWRKLLDDEMDNNVEVAKMVMKVRMNDERVFENTKLKLQALSLAELEMILEDIVVKVTSILERPSIQISTRIISGYI